MMSTKGSKQPEPVANASSAPTQEDISLSVDLVASNLRSAPAATLQGMAMKAQELLRMDGSVMQAPGGDSTTL